MSLVEQFIKEKVTASNEELFPSVFSLDPRYPEDSESLTNSTFILAMGASAFLEATARAEEGELATAEWLSYVAKPRRAGSLQNGPCSQLWGFRPGPQVRRGLVDHQTVCTLEEARLGCGKDREGS